MTAKRFLRVFGAAGRYREVLRCRREQRDWWFLTRAFLRLGPVSYPHIVRLADGATIEARDWSDLRTIWVVCWGAEYTLRGDERIIVDAGANIGVFSTHAARVSPRSRILAVEAYPDTADRLRETISRNKLGDRVDIVAAALVGRPGFVTFDDAPETLRDTRRVIDGSASGLRVEGVTLDALLERLDGESVDYLKMDIEGSEYRVVEETSPAAWKRVRRIGMEYHGNGKVEDLLERLKGLGFSVTRHLRKGGAGILELARPG